MATPNGNGTNGHVGRVVQIIGPVVDVEFTENYLPPIYEALRITSDGFDVPEPINVIAEVQQHLGEGRVRAVSMLPTDGMVRGMKATDTGGPITVPVGEGTLGPRHERDRRSGRQPRRHSAPATLSNSPSRSFF